MDKVTPDEPWRSPGERVEHLVAFLPPESPLRAELTELQSEIAEQEDLIAESREALEKMEAVLKKVTSPANRIGTFLGSRGPETAQIVVGGSDYFCNVDPRIRIKSLRVGTRVLVNEAYVIVGDLGQDSTGPIAKVAESLGADRVRIGGEGGTSSVVLLRGAQLGSHKLKAGDEVRVDANQRVAVEILKKGTGDDYYLESVPELPWEKVGGQDDALRAIRETIELPLLHVELFEKFKHAVPKGFLLYGPPGCGKTLIGKATAYNLTTRLKEKTGEEMREYFMHIKGPEILNMWLGESERKVREIFATAREKRREGFLPFLFIDEAESILGTRRSSRYSSIVSTLVPMFCTEMDGLDSLNDVVIILASNRADLIDPAILRPGRIDRKIKINRPDRVGAEEIFRVYLSPDLPYDPTLLEKESSESAAASLAATITERLFAKSERNRFLELSLRSGRKETLHRGDLVSGAIIASIVERAKSLAIRRIIASGIDDGIRLEDLEASADSEYAENDIFPPGDVTEDWLKLIDYDGENIVRVSPIRADVPREARPGQIV